jgi:hypothetical protein
MTMIRNNSKQKIVSVGEGVENWTLCALLVGMQNSAQGSFSKTLRELTCDPAVPHLVYI